MKNIIVVLGHCCFLAHCISDNGRQCGTPSNNPLGLVVLDQIIGTMMDTKAFTHYIDTKTLQDWDIKIIFGTEALGYYTDTPSHLDTSMRLRHFST